MELYVEAKIMGDAYGPNYGNGLSMSGSQTAADFFLEHEEPACMVWRDNRKHRMLVHKSGRGKVLEIATEFVNESEEPVTLEMLASFAIKGIPADRIHRMQSFWSAEGKLRTETIDELHLEPSWTRHALRVEKFGNLGSMPVRKYFPFLVLEDSRKKQFLGIQLYCPSSWQMEILCREDESLAVIGGIADNDYGHWYKTLAPGESFLAPRAVIARGSSLYEVCDRLVKAQKPDVAKPDLDMGIVFNEYCTTWGNPTFENVAKICDRLVGEGIQYLVIDSGWYGKGEEWWKSIGDWEVNEERFPGGMKLIADYIRSHGMIPGIWFEFESLSPLCSHYDDKRHLLTRNGVPLTVGEKRFWDMEDPWVKYYLEEKVIDFLKKCGFGYLKVDYNDTIGVGCDGAESMGEALRNKMQATQEFFRKIKEQIPDIVIENCSSGGHRLEPSMMELVSQASFSDAHETVAIPLIAANLHRVIPPYQSQIWAALRKDDSRSRLYYSLCSTFLGRMCLSGDIYGLTDKQWSVVREAIEFYKMAAKVIRDGVTVKCEYTTTQYNHPTGSQLVVRTLGKVSLVVYHRFADSEGLGMEFPEGSEVLKQFGRAEEDFSAEAWLYRVK